MHNGFSGYSFVKKFEGMEKLRILIARNLQGKKVLLLFVLTTLVYIFMITNTIPKVMEYANGMQLFDMMPLGYDLDYTTNLLDALDVEGRRLYKYGQLPFDMVYPVLFGITYCLLLSYFLIKLDRFTKWYSYLCLLPLVAGIADYAENLGIITLLNNYPKISQSTVTITSSFSLLKSMGTTLTFLILIGILIVLGIKTLKK